MPSAPAPSVMPPSHIWVVVAQPRNGSHPSRIEGMALTREAAAMVGQNAGGELVKVWAVKYPHGEDRVGLFDPKYYNVAGGFEAILLRDTE